VLAVTDDTGGISAFVVEKEDEGYPVHAGGYGEQRAEISAAAERVGTHDVRVFGSVARGEDTPESDVDLLVDFPARERGLLSWVAHAPGVPAGTRQARSPCSQCGIRCGGQRSPVTARNTAVFLRAGDRGIVEV
jgi:hypothetical protein